jgi:hypothetical protein
MDDFPARDLSIALEKSDSQQIILTKPLVMDKYISIPTWAVGMATKTFHIYKDKERTQRTTVSLNNYVHQLLALKVGSVPDSPDSHNAIRQWLQAQLDEDVDPDRVHTSQWLQGKAVLAIADKKLSKKYWDWRLSE